MSGTTLLLVDCQKDFHPGGSLAAPTADGDASRIADLIRQNASDIDRIVATMDSHHKLDIGHSCFWTNDKGERPAPSTIISAEDLEKGVWKPRPDMKLPPDEAGEFDPEIFPESEKLMDDSGCLDLAKYCIEYARRLEAKGRFQICIWPEHCIIGSEGHAIVDVIGEALKEWSDKTGRSVEWVHKGQNLLTEMYSALEADIPVSTSTSFNEKLQVSLQKSDRLIVCGQTMSHCVNYTLRDIVDHWPEEELYKIALVTDCASAVPSFEEAAETFQEDMEAAGVLLMKASHVM